MPDRNPATEAHAAAVHLINETAHELGTDDPEAIIAQLRRDLDQHPRFSECIRAALRRLETRDGR